MFFISITMIQEFYILSHGPLADGTLLEDQYFDSLEEAIQALPPESLAYAGVYNQSIELLKSNSTLS